MCVCVCRFTSAFVAGVCAVMTIGYNKKRPQVGLDTPDLGVCFGNLINNLMFPASFVLLPLSCNVV